MKKNTWPFFLSSWILIQAVLLCAPLYADELVFKNGGVLKGKIKEKHRACILLNTAGLNMCCSRKNIAEVKENGRNEAAIVSPEQARQFADKGEKFLAEKEYDQAIAAFDVALALDSSQPDFFYFLASAYKATDDTEMLKYVYGQAKARFPKHPTIARIKQMCSPRG